MSSVYSAIFSRNYLNVIGYYSFQLGNENLSQLSSSSKNDYIFNYTACLAINLNWIGAPEEYRRQDLGNYLLVDVFKQTARLSGLAGFFALTLISLVAESTAFHESIDFKTYSENLRQPNILHPLASILELVRC